MTIFQRQVNIMTSWTLLFWTVSLALSALASAESEDFIYAYKCIENSCLKVEIHGQDVEKALSLPVCRMFCGDSIGTIWPKPSGPVRFESFMIHIDTEKIVFNLPNIAKQTPLWAENKKRFMEQIMAAVPDSNKLRKGGHPLEISIEVANTADILPKLSLDTDETYKLTIASGNDNNVTAKIIANNFFGARHGLETLSQLIVYDDIRNEMQILAKGEIHDGPVYKWRGLLLDTSRNFYSIKAIKRTLDAMAMVKLNTFHWHLTDTHSFPLEVKSQPDLHKVGAYSPRKVYTHEAIAALVEYGRVRGIRVMPEFDAPAHVGEGWQHKNMTVCFRAQPWKQYCGEPPCGQLNPTVDGLYPVLEDIYREMLDLFDPDVFHMGGDELSINCWNSSQEIRDWMQAKGWSLNETDFIHLWDYFQSKALQRVDSAAKKEKPLITLWTSRLTDVPFIDDYLDRDRYLIQIWTTGSDPKVKDILKRGFRVIISNYDALYFDCGGPGWVSGGNNWCSPYIGWQKVYMNNIGTIAGEYQSLVLGAEAAVWSEQIDEYTLDARFWPRASALAERLWSDPTDTWRQAEARMLYHRERLVENGIGAESMQPEWCLQNEDECPTIKIK